MADTGRKPGKAAGGRDVPPAVKQMAEANVRRRGTGDPEPAPRLTVSPIANTA